MKKIFYSAYAMLMMLLAISCGKEKSTDLPLPVDRKESVYITTNNNNLISYNPYTGSKQWEVFFKGVSQGVPVLYKKKLYLTTDAGYFYAVDILKGEISIEKNLQKPSILSIAVDNDKVYMGSLTDSFYCYDLSGNKLWSYNPGAKCSSSPQVANGNVYFGANVKMHAVNASTGAAVWTSAAVIGSILSSPRVSNGLVYYGATDKKIYAIRENNGSLQWNYSTGDIITSSPMVYGGMCIIGSTDYGVYCIDTTSPSAPPSGELRWKYMTNERINYSSATIHEASNTVLIGGYDFNLYAIDHVSGTLKWKYPAGSLIKSSPVVYGNYVYFVAVDRYLYCVDVRNGSAVWKSYLNGSTESSPMVDDLKNGQYPGVSGMSKY